MTTAQPGQFPIVAICVAAGRLDAIGRLLSRVAQDDRMAYVIWQQPDPDHDILASEALECATDNPVSEVRDGDVIEMGGIYVVPPEKIPFLDGDTLRLRAFSRSRGLGRSIDDFLASLSGQCGTNAACVVLSGITTVSSPGLRRIREHGGITISQTLETTAFEGTAGLALENGPVDLVCAVDDIVPALRRHFDRRQAIGPCNGKGRTASLASTRGRNVTGVAQNVDRLVHCEQELLHTQGRRHNEAEGFAVANEARRDSNAEIPLVNEALWSRSREHETVHDELKEKIDQVSAENADLRNLVAATRQVVLLLDRDLCIRSFTESATNIFPLRGTDLGRKLASLSSVLHNERYLNDAALVLKGHAAIVRKVMSVDGQRTWSMRVAPFPVANGQIDGIALSFQDITPDLAMQADLDAQRRRLQLALSVAGIGVWEYNVKTGETVLDDNERILLGIGPDDDTDVESIIARIHEDDRGKVESELRRAIGGDKGYDVMFRIRDSSGSTRYLRGLGCIVEGEVPRRMVGVNLDVTAEQALKDARETLVRELNHRVKNLFAIISGIIAMAARNVTDVNELALDVRNRINALGKAHSLTQTGGADRSISLRVLVETALSPYAGHHAIALHGDDILVDQDQVTSLGLILHEWATNAVKYGALCNGGGQLRVGWRRRGRSGFELRWSETSAMTDAHTGKAGGFGSRLVELSTKQLRGTLKVAQQGQIRTMCLEVPLAEAATA